MNTKITLDVKDQKPKIKFTPALDETSYTHLLNNALNNMPQALATMLASVPVLRPASVVEHEHKIYVFNEGERGEVENRLYKYRKDLYDTIAAVFSQMLSTVFPDIEYIEGCKHYQQEYCMEHPDDEEHKRGVEETTKYVREHFDEILKEVCDDVQEEQ